MATEYVIVMTAVESEPLAGALAREAVDQRLAACVQSIPITSTYRWDESIETAQEHILHFKTASDKVEQLQAFIVANHEYDVPEVLVVPVSGGHGPYLDWVRASTRMSG